MKKIPCPKVNNCSKILVILGKDMFGSQYIEAIKEMCAKCQS